MFKNGVLTKFKMYNRTFKITSNKSKNKQIWGYLISFLIPFAVFMIYFAFQKFNVLTVDLGQQYVDFLSYFRQNLFTNPGKLIYNFSNGLGGSMLATDAYYLLSPTNLLLFLFPKSLLPVAIYLIIGVKFGLAGLSSYHYWRRQNIFLSLAASTSYGLSGYMIANYFNLMWLDSIILLPLLIQAIDRLFEQKKNHLILITFALWITNFYTGFMTLLFGFLYFISKVFFQSKKLRLPLFLTYLKNSILASFLSSFVLLPVFFELLSGKASTSVKWTLSWQFPLQEELTKLTTGAYSFHEMEAGMPNIYMTSSFLLLAICYFFSTALSWKKKVANGLLLVFLVLSLSFTPLVLLWHLGQFPVWYPGRFSFILIFFCLVLGMKFLAAKQKLPLWTKIVIGILSIALVSYWYFVQSEITFLTETTLALSTLFITLALIFLFFIFTEHKFDKIFLFVIVLLEASINLAFSLNSLSFQKNSDYQNFAINSQKTTQYLEKHDPQLYRFEKTFYRSDDDPFTANYNGISNFNSVTNQKVLNFLSNLGYLHNSNSFTNNGGTALTDALLGIKYYLEPNVNNQIAKNKRLEFNNDNHRMDLDSYAIQKEFKQLVLVKNSRALPLVFLSPETNQKVKFYVDQPIHNQIVLFRQITNTSVNLFNSVTIPQPTLYNVHRDKMNQTENNDLFTINKKKVQGEVHYLLKINTNDAYYLEIPNGLDDLNANLYVNNNQVDLSVRDGQTHLISLDHNQKGTKISINFVLKQQYLDLSQIKIFRLNTIKMTQILNRFNKNQPKIKQTTALSLSSNAFSTKQDKRLLTTIPYSKNWLIFDRGKKLTVKSYLGTFLSANLSKGKHQLTFIYVPWVFIVGILLSLVSLIILKLI